MSQTRKQRRGEAIGRRGRSGQSRGFTLIELLVVLAIIAILMAVFAPSMIGIKDRLWQINCASNERQLMMGWLMWSRDHGGKLPKATNGTPDCFVNTGPSPGCGNTAAAATTGAIFPYVNELSIYKCPSSWYNYYVTYTISGEVNGEWSPECAWGWDTGPSYKRTNPSLMSQLVNPSGTVVLVEEYDPRGSNWASFSIKLKGTGYFDMPYAQWNDAPGANHRAGFDIGYIGGVGTAADGIAYVGPARGDNQAFADGHVEFFTYKTTASLAADHQWSGDFSGNVDLERLQKKYHPW